MKDGKLSLLFVGANRAAFQPLIQQLGIEGHHAQAAASIQQAQELARSVEFDFVFIDVVAGSHDDFAFIGKSEADTLFAPIAAPSQRDLALKAIEKGAEDVLEEPVTLPDVLLLIEKARLRHERQHRAVAHTRPAKRAGFAGFVAESPEMQKLLDIVQRLSQYSTTVLITGESGTGKELVARAIHRNSSRSGMPFVALNCGAIPENLLEAELFGYRKGSFTDAVRDKKGLFEEAHGGTVFLDEIGETPLLLQVKLLRALQERQIQPIGDERPVPIDVRIIAATLRDLDSDIKAGHFREDLYYRLNVVSLHIPPLRSRLEDIIPLATFFVRKHARRLGIKVKKLSKEVEPQLLACPWKGNVRELENCIERALVMSEGVDIGLEALPEQVRDARRHETHALQELVAGDNLSIKHMTRELEVSLIKRALKKTRGNRTHAAKVLEISHRALLYKMKEYAIKD